MMVFHLFSENTGEILVSQVQRPVGIGPFHRLRHQVYGFRGVVAIVRDRVSLQDIQDLDHMRTTRTRGRHGVNIISAIGAVHGLADAWGVALHIRHGNETTVLGHLRHQ